MTKYKPFDLEAAKRGDPVVTRDGRKARIVCFDLLGSVSHPLLVLVTNGAREDQQQAMLDGRHYTHEETRHDIFMAPPSIPEGWTPYDPTAILPENVEELEVMLNSGERVVLSEHNLIEASQSEHIISYRVTKWKASDLDCAIDELIEFFDTFGLDNMLKKVLRQFAEAIKKECGK